MNLFTVEVVALCFCIALLLVFAVALRKRLQLGDDFVLGRRRLTARLGSIAVSMNGVPTWWLLLLVATAYANGGAAIWIALALVGGVILGGWSLAPRLRARSQMQQSTTISQLFAGDVGEKRHVMLLRSAAFIAIVSLGLTFTAQLQLISTLLADALAVSREIVIVTTILFLCVALLLAGFWLTVVSDAAQIALFLLGGVISFIALFIANIHVANAAAVWPHDTWFAGHTGVLTISFLVGTAFLIGDAAGQSSLLTRFMACKDDADLLSARRRAVIFAAITSLLAVAIGWLARSLSSSDPPSIETFTDVLQRALSPKFAAVLMFSVLIAFVAAMSNGLLAVASHFANDFRRISGSLTLTRCRWALVIAALSAGVAALYLPQVTPQANFDRMLFGWHAMGAAFGPLVIVRLSGKRIRPGSTLGALWAGFLLTVIFHLMPSTPGELLERSLPFTASLGIALSGGERRRNPDRADRGERTIHDRLPI
jgi:sodium/proline symporter